MIGLHITIQQQPDGRIKFDLETYVKGDTPNEKARLAMLANELNSTGNSVQKCLDELCASLGVTSDES